MCQTTLLYTDDDAILVASDATRESKLNIFPRLLVDASAQGITCRRNANGLKERQKKSDSSYVHEFVAIAIGCTAVATL